MSLKVSSCSSNFWISEWASSTQLCDWGRGGRKSVSEKP